MIIKADNFTSIKEQIYQTDSKTLIILDIDDVVFQPCDQILQSSYHHNEAFEEMIDEKCEKKRGDELYSLIWLQKRVESIDQEMKTLLREMQKRTGRFGHIPSVENWCLQDLKTLGYHFEKSWRKDSFFSFGTTRLKDLNRVPSFGGIIFTNTGPKGKVLKDFLNVLQAKLFGDHFCKRSREKFTFGGRDSGRAENLFFKN